MRGHTLRFAARVFVMMLLTLCVAAGAWAAVGFGDSPPFSLDTRDSSVTGTAWDGCPAGLPLGVDGILVEVMLGADVVGSAVTADGGSFAIGELAPESYVVRASGPAWETASSSVVLTGGEPHVVSFDLHPIPSDPILEDDFDDGNADGWTTLGSCSWEVVEGEYVTSLSGHQLMCMSIVGDASWTDYAFGADVMSEGGVANLIVLRYQDPSNYYVVCLRSDWLGQDEVFISKLVDGVWHSEVAIVPYPSCNGVWYRLRGVVRGHTVEVYVDDQLLLSWEDSENPFLSGPAGVVCWTGCADTSAVRFDNVVVEEPPGPPEQITVTDIGTGAHLKIDCSPPPPPGSRYYLYRSTTPGPPYELVRSARVSPDGASFLDGVYSGLEEWTEYYYVVRTYRCPHYSGYSEEARGTPKCPVVLVHGIGCYGLFGSTQTWSTLVDSLVSPLGPAYPPDSVWLCGAIYQGAGIRDSAERLDLFIKSKKSAIWAEHSVVVPKIDIVAHSLGGLIARDYMHGLDPGHAHQVDKVIMLGTPNSGAKSATTLSLLSDAGGAGCLDAALDLTKGVVESYEDDWDDAGSGCGELGPEYYLVAGLHFLDLYRGDVIVLKKEVFAIEACRKYRLYGIWHSGLPKSASVIEEYVIPILEGAPPADHRQDYLPAREEQDDRWGILAGRVDSLGAGGADTVHVWIDAGVDTVSFQSLWFEGDLTLTCHTPSGAEVDSSYAWADPTMEYGRQTPAYGPRTDLYLITTPEPGLWKLQVDCATGPSDYVVWATGSGAVSLTSVLPDTAVQPIGGVVVGSELGESGSPITGAVCQAKIRELQGSQWDSLSLFDDGLHGDGEPDDGVYSNTYQIRTASTRYEVRLDAAGQALISGDFQRIESGSFVAGDPIPPSVDVLFPDGGEELSGDVPCTLRWQVHDASGVGSLEVLLSYDNGSTYPDTLASFTAPGIESTLVWIPPATYLTDCRLAVLACDASGNCGSDVSDEVWSIVPATGIADEESDTLPRRPALFQNVPNPFNPTTTISYIVPGGARRAELSIYSVTGALVRRWEWDSPAPGVQHVLWDSQNDQGRCTSSGVYFYRLQIDEWSDLKKMVILK